MQEKAQLHTQGCSVPDRGVTKVSISDARYEAFLGELAIDGNVSRAALASGVDRSNAYQRRLKNPVFAERWETAVETAIDAIQAEAFRRAVEGVSEPVFYKGVEFGRVTRYSDALLIALLKRYRPEYRDGGRFEIANAPEQVLKVEESPIIVARKVAFALALGLRAAEATRAENEDIE